VWLAYNRSEIANLTFHLSRVLFCHCCKLLTICIRTGILHFLVYFCCNRETLHYLPVCTYSVPCGLKAVVENIRQQLFILYQTRADAKSAEERVAIELNL